MNAPQAPALVNLHIDAPTITINTSLLVEEANSIIIDSPMMAELAGEGMKFLKAHIDTIEAKRKEFVGPINEAHAAIQAFFKQYSDPLNAALQITKTKYVTYQTEQARLAAEEQKVRDAEAAKEKARLEAAAATAAAAARKEEERLRAEAAAAYEAGDLAKAAKIEAKVEQKVEAAAEKVADLQTQAATTVAAVVAPATSKVAGVSKMKDNWQFQIDDINKIPREFLCADEKKIGQYVKAMKGDAKIDGVRIFNNATVAVRT